MTDRNHRPQPQQQPNKTQTTTQHQKQPHIKPPKKSNTQKNPQQQPNKNTENKDQQAQNSWLHFLQIQQAFFYQTEQIKPLFFS
jgi:hypothetical protein